MELPGLKASSCPSTLPGQVALSLPGPVGKPGPVRRPEVTVGWGEDSLHTPRLPASSWGAERLATPQTQAWESQSPSSDP